ncbi:GNAT family N-acetyltransferase [Bradyrhizobium sp. 2TAF24]|uniref:GNAT family N-acetyltransferase n=1 Tax=Bradyrhizobium sp. 2TAF24 TaxID=3233011 RepID=UPI003F8F7156
MAEPGLDLSSSAAACPAPTITIRPSRDDDVDAMLAIYRYHIRHGVEPGAVQAAEPLDPDDLKQRRKNMRSRRLPHIVAEIDGIIVGYAYAVLFRKRPAYRYTAKHSIYVHHDHMRAGVGRVLLPALVDACAAAGYRQLIGYIDAANAASIRLHENCGFRQVGYLPAIGYKFGHWSATVMMQRSLGAGDTTPPDSVLTHPAAGGPDGHG